MTTEKSSLDIMLRVGERLGVPLLILAAVLWMSREAGMALYTTAIVPLVEAHGKFLDSTSRNLEEIGTTQRQQAETLQEIAVGQKEIATIIEKQDPRN
jgi:hypothetical protein